MALAITVIQEETMNIKTIEKYLAIKASLKLAQETEREMRLEILDQIFPAAGVGTLNAALGEYAIKGTFSTTTTIDADILADIEDSLSDEELACIKWKPSLIAAHYKMLGEDLRGRLDEAVMVKPSMPTLKIEKDES